MLAQPEVVASIRFAGIAAIILDLVIIAVGGLILIALVGVPYGGVVIAVWGLPFYLLISAACVGQLIVAINLIQKRAWARVAFLVSAAGTAFVSLVVIVLVWAAGLWLSKPTEAVPNAAEQVRELDLIVLVVFAMPIALSIWWFILFTRPRTIAIFESSSSSPVTASGRAAHPFTPPK